MYDLLDTSTPNSGLGTPLRSGGEIINANFRKLHAWMESRSNIAAQSIPTLAAGGPRYLLAADFVPGDPMPLALYERTTTPSDVTHPAWVQSADLQWWKLVPQGGVIYIEQLGGKADADINGAGGRDNLDPLYRAMSFSAWQANADSIRTYEIHFGAGNYRFSDTIEPHYITHIRGIGSAPSNVTLWHFPANKTFMIWPSYNTTGETTVGGALAEATGSSIENIAFLGKTSSTDHARAGFHVRTQITCRGCSFFYVGGDAIRVIGIAGAGIADFCVFQRIHIHSCSRDAIFVDGNDANVCQFSMIDIHGPSWVDGTPISGGVGGAGIRDACSFGNGYEDIHIAGFGNHGVWYNPGSGGRAYRLISANTGDGEATTPGTNDQIWYDVGALTAANSQFPAWTATPTVPYRLQIPYWFNGATGFGSDFYIESGVEGHAPNGMVIIGGANSATKYSNVGSGTYDGVVFNQGIGGRQRYLSGQAGYAYNKEYAYASVGTRAQVLGDPNMGITMLSHGRHKDTESGGPDYAWRYFGIDIVYGRSNAKPYWEQTTPITTRTFGRSTAQPDYLVLHDVAFQNPFNSNIARVIGVRDAPPVSGDHATGETYIMSNPLAYGYWAVAYTVAGSPGTRGTVPIVGLPSVTPQDNGDFVIQNTSNTQVTFKYKGSDGVIRSASLTLS